MTEQRQQNDRMAERSVAMVAGSEKLAEAAQELVMQDATRVGNYRLLKPS